jgi:2-keto-4-pentenoate hydratase/2-oxohepta-3-ene-1,7-dioic acid hydratase in catechol pathway
MVELMARFNEVPPQLRRLENSSEGWRSLSEVHLRAPVARPGKMLAIGLNYADHIAETGHEAPKEQVWFMKASSSVSGPYDTIQIPKASPNSVDYEVELVAVIGKGGWHISREQAPAAVFGYCVGNDVSVREWQRHSPQWSIAKSFDTHSPFGPWITSPDELRAAARGRAQLVPCAGATSRSVPAPAQRKSSAALGRFWRASRRSAAG